MSKFAVKEGAKELHLLPFAELFRFILNDHLLASKGINFTTGSMFRGLRSCCLQRGS